MPDNNINWQPAHLEDDLVILKPLAEEDFDALYQVAADPLIWQQHPSSDRHQLAVFREFFAGALASQSAFVIIDRQSGQMIGSTRFYDISPESVAIGFTFFARKYWGGKYNGAVKKLMLDYAFQHVDKVIFHIGATNFRSQIATGRFGAVKSREFYTQAGTEQRLSFEYELTKAAWKARPILR